MNTQIQRQKSYQIRLDLIPEYSYVGLNALDKMFATIPYIATIKKIFYLQNEGTLEIKLNNGEFNYEDSLPSLEKNINRHKSNTWIKVKHSNMLVEAYMKNIRRFIKNLFARYKLNFYYNIKEKRCDIKEKNSNYWGDLRSVVITFEPGNPYTHEEP